MIDFKNSAILKLKKDATVTHANDIAPLLVEGEVCISQFSTVRDYVIFTNKRILTVNVQGVTGKKKDYSSIPYSKIQAFSIETAGTLDLDSELEIYVSGLGKVKIEISGKNDIAEIGKLIADRVL